MPTGTGVRIALLGPLLVDGSWIALTREQRIILAALALQPGEIVSYDALTDAIGHDITTRSLQARVRRLQNDLRPSGLQILNVPGAGYRLLLADDEVDILRFERLAEKTVQFSKADHWEQVLLLAQEALGLCRSTPLADAPSLALELRWFQRLEDARMQTVLYRLRAELHLAQHEEAIRTLNRLTAEHPAEEIFWALLMLGHYRSGSRPAAKKTYEAARAALKRELDVDPGDLIENIWSQIEVRVPPLDIPVP